jgi:putative transcriptional regulator
MDQQPARTLEPPTPDQVREARKKSGLSQKNAALLIHLHGDRVWRRYESGDMQMHPAFWELFLIKTNAIPE